jgi:hypothetical protein
VVGRPPARRRRANTRQRWFSRGAVRWTRPPQRMSPRVGKTRCRRSASSRFYPIMGSRDYVWLKKSYASLRQCAYLTTLLL